jgi:DNA-binding CsgD family transcriptional regulator
VTSSLDGAPGLAFLASGGHPELLAVLREDLVGRAAECGRIQSLLESAVAGHADRVVLVGEAGIGKSALLAWGAAQAREFRVAGAVGVEAEQELAFAGLSALLRPFLDGLAELPEPQRTALEGALALGPPEPGAGFAVGAATLGLLASAAEDAPLLVVLDDVQWIDEPTRQTLAFAIRRLDADRVAVLAASRPDGLGPLGGARLETFELTRLGHDDAFALALRSAGGSLAEPVAARLLDAAYGNPLALVELPRLLDAEQLAGESPLPAELPVGANIARSFAGTAAALPAESQLALVVAAVLGSDDLIELGAALELLDVGADALTPAELSGLLSVAGTRVTFRHPLVRSAVIESAAAADLRRVHSAVAASLPAGERRARHRAAACAGPDEAVAADLEAAAHEARDRRAAAAAVSLLERAAELSPSAEDGGRRLFLAAEAAWIAGLTDAAIPLAERVLERTVDGLTRAEALHLLGQIAHQTAPPRTAQARHLEAAELVAGDPARAAAVLTDLFTSYVYDGRPEKALATAERLWALPRRGELAEFFASHCLGIALIWNGRPDEGRPHVLRALELVDLLHDEPRYLAIAGMDASWIDDTDLAGQLSERAIAVARERGAIAALPALLKFSAWADFDRGRWPAAYATASEAVALAAETGQTAQRCGCLGILLSVEALTGREDAAYAHARDALALADGLELPWHRAGFLHELGWLELGLGRLERAVERFEEMRELIEGRGIRLAGQSSGADHVEALVRLGEVTAARSRLAEFEGLEDRGSAGVRALRLRCAGLLADDAAFEVSFREAIELHPDADAFALARTRLCYGERLRRAGRRRAARVELEAALDVFEPLGAEPWAARAHGELVASGRRLRRRGAEGRDELTPQELQVAIHVARGLSNREIAQTLFLSPKTVESHLTRVYRKLDLHARGELAELFGDQV